MFTSSPKVWDATSPSPHVNTRWDHSDAKSHGSSHELWGDPRVNKLLITCNQKEVNYVMDWIIYQR